MLAYIIPYSDNPKVGTISHWLLGLALLDKVVSIVLAIFLLTPFWVAVRGKAILKIACIGNSVLGKT